ncbi:MAG: BolA family transcriptional regulator [Alphaproteobacteria bacterium]|nr:MAG: BolA family transcriptional regulator [Alphaproteobacteria bacterium]
MPLPSDQLEKILGEKFPDSQIQIDDLAGDNDHYRVHIAAPAFNGKSRVDMHKMVFAAIRGTPAEGIHALSLVTKATT